MSVLTHMLRSIGSFLIGIALIFIGIDHFLNTEWYVPIVPSLLGVPGFWVLFSGVVEIVVGLGLLFPKTRTYASLSGAWLMVFLYIANANMWINNIPLDGITYSTPWHVARLVIQIILILLLCWIGEITPFKGKEKLYHQLEVFEGRITSMGFSSGHRFVIGQWNDTPFGSFNDIMWVTPNQKRILVCGDEKIASYISSMYTFEEVAIQPVSIVQNPNGLQIQTNTIEISLEWSKGFTIPFRRSLFFIKNVESWFAKVFFKTKTYGITNNHRQEWYMINHLSKVIQCEGYMNNESLGTLSNIDETCGFGFSDPPRKPSSVLVKTHIL